jgi:undecaprenyl-diphosphatase
MQVFAWGGHGVVDGAIASAILAYGAVTRDRRFRQAGLAALLAVIASGLLANLFKLFFEMPRPTRSGSFGFPSGHASTAFALAGALSQAFPVAAPFFYLVAVLVGVARLYDRSHFVTDVIAGGFLGSATGFLIARILPGARGAALPGRRIRWEWVLPIAIAIPPLAFFTAYERSVAAHRLSAPGLPAHPQRDVVILFGTPEARPLLLQGWSEDRRWGTMPMVWAEGLSATLRVPPLLPADHRVRVKVRPYARRPGRPPCQVVEVALNGIPVARLLLEKGWNDYELKVPKSVIQRGENELGFQFAYAEPESAGADRRAVSAAFASLEAFVEDAGSR